MQKVNNNRILSTHSLCKRAGKLLLGFDVVGEAICQERPRW